MKKVLVFFIMLSFSFLQAGAQVITGEVKYTVSEARDELMNTTPVKFDKNLIRADIIDKNNSENISFLLKGITDLKDRTLAYFSDGSYGVLYKDNPYSVLYYNSEGVLTHKEIKDSLEYPYKTYKYNTFGKPVNMSLRVSEKESFIFDKDGKLIAHWLGANCYDEAGNVIMTRKILKD